MMHNLLAIKIWFGVIVSILGVAPLLAAELSYRPVNPSFGGNPLNGSQLLGIANIHKPKVEREERSEAEYFQDQIQRRILSTISAAIIDDLRDSETPEGTYAFDDFTLNYVTSSDGKNVNVTIAETNGATTTIVIPRTALGNSE